MWLKIKTINGWRGEEENEEATESGGNDKFFFHFGGHKIRSYPRIAGLNGALAKEGIECKHATMIHAIVVERTK